MNRRSFLFALPIVATVARDARARDAAVASPSRALSLSEAPRLLFHKDAFALAMAPLRDAETGLSIQPLQRFDVLYGSARVRPQIAYRFSEPTK